MTSPFPGMDPYLEAHWGDVHTKLATYTADQLNTRLPDELVARAEEYVTLDADDDESLRHLSPDVHLIEYPPEPAARPPAAGLAAAVAEPVLVRVPIGPRTQRRVVIIDTRSGNRVVTAIEYLSGSNKIGEEGRAAYRRKRQEFLNAGVSVAELDLLRDGGYVLYPPKHVVARRLRGPYRICVTRGWAAHTAEMYPVTLRHRLPAIRIPLRRTDPDVVLELQPLIEQAYANGRYGRTLDYRAEPEPWLSPEDAAWADELLKAAGKR